jgi:hypothetical protein
METLNSSLETVLTFTSAILAFLTAILVPYAITKKRQADTHLAELLKKEAINPEYFIKSLSEGELRQLKAFEDIIRSHGKDLAESQKNNIEEQIFLLKLQSIRRTLLELAKRLNKPDRERVLNTINQTSALGRQNYVNRILEQSQIDENILSHSH